MEGTNRDNGPGGAGGDQPAETGGLSRRQWVTLVVVTLSTFLVLVDASVVNLAVPQILEDFEGTIDSATWVVAGFVLSFAALLLLFGRLGDLFGRRRVFVWGIGVFTAASLACALATSIELLIAGRVAQGVGAAMLTPSTLSLIKSTFPKEKLGLAFGVEGITAGVATAIGPTLGGALTTSFSWRWIFIINVPLGILLIVVALLVIPESRDAAASRRIDIPGTLLSGAGIFFLVFAFVEGQKLGWNSTAILGSFAAAAILILAFILVERWVREPLVDLSLFSDRLFATGNVLRGLVLFVLLGTVFVLPLYWQTQLGYSAIQSALVLLPVSVVSFFLSPLAGSLADKVNVKWLVGSGFALTAIGAFWISRLSVESDWAFFIAPLALFGGGLAFLFAPTITATLRNVPDEKSGVASGIATASQELGSAFGVAVVAAVLQNRLLAEVRDSLSNSGLPTRAQESLLSGISEGGFGEGTSAADPDATAGAAASAPQVEGLIQEAFAGALGTSLLFVAAAAVVGFILALLFFSGSPDDGAYEGATGQGTSHTSDGDALASRGSEEKVPAQNSLAEDRGEPGTAV